MLDLELTKTFESFPFGFLAPHDPSAIFATQLPRVQPNRPSPTMHHDRLHTQPTHQFRQPLLIRPWQVGRVSHPRGDARLAELRQSLPRGIAGELLPASGRISFPIEGHRERISRLAGPSEFQDSPPEILQAVQRAVRPQALADLMSRRRPSTPVDDHLDPLGLSLARQIYSLDQQTHHGSPVRPGRRLTPPQPRQVRRQRDDSPTIRSAQVTRLLDLEAAEVFLQALLLGQFPLPLPLQLSGEQAILGGHRVVLP